MESRFVFLFFTYIYRSFHAVRMYLLPVDMNNDGIVRERKMRERERTRPGSLSFTIRDGVRSSPGVCTLLSIRNVGLDSQRFVDNARSVPFEPRRAVFSFSILLG